MARKVIPDEALQMLRSIGDLRPRGRVGLEELEPPPDRMDAIIDEVREKGLEAFAVGTCADLVDDAAKLVYLGDIDVDKVTRARDLFADHGQEIASALLLAALPQAYAADAGSRVLAATHQLGSNLQRRIPATAQFLTTIMSVTVAEHEVPGDWKRDEPFPAGRLPSWKLCAALRVYHAAIRKKLSGVEPFKGHLAEEKPLNQEDLLGMLLTFTITVFEDRKSTRLNSSHRT